MHLKLEWLSLLPDAEKLEQVTNMGSSGEIRIWRYRRLQGPRSDHCHPLRFYSGIEESPLDQSPHQLLS